MQNKEIKRYIIHPKDLGNEAYITCEEEFFYMYATNLLRGCFTWDIDYSVGKGSCTINYGNDDVEKEANYLKGTVIREDGFYTVLKDGQHYCVARCRDFLKMVSQDQVDLTLFLYGLFGTRRKVQEYTPANTIVIWKDGFFRIGNANDINKRKMLCLYLGIYTDDELGEGVGMIEDFSIADFDTFSQVASPELVTAVTTDMSKRNGTPTIGQMWRDMVKRRKNNE